MSRKLIVTIHLALAAFFTPILMIMGISGGLYLIGEKGKIDNERIYQGELSGFNFRSKNREEQVRQFIQAHNIKVEFEYLRGGSNFAITRPTSKQHLLFELKNRQLIVTKKSPNFIASIIELHKGHGPKMFKTYQKIMAIGLFLILLSGLYLGLTSRLYRYKTIAISGLGFATFLFFVLF